MSILNKISSIIGTETDLKQSALPLSILSGLVLILFFLIGGELREFFEAGGLNLRVSLRKELLNQAGQAQFQKSYEEVYLDPLHLLSKGFLLVTPFF